MKRLREYLLVVFFAGLFAAILCFESPTILQSFDYVVFYKPNFQFLYHAVQDSRLPLWNPYVGLGRPYLADAQNAVFYPPTYLVLLGERTGLFLLVWCHSVLAVFGMRFFANSLKVSGWQRDFIAFSFLVSGALTARWMTGQLLYCCAICYVPWLFYFANLADETWPPWRQGVYALLLALQFLCGHPQVFWFSCIGQAAFIFCRSIRLPLAEALRGLARSLWNFGVACAWSAGLLAMILLPFFELAGQGNRGAASAAFANFDKLEWEALASLIFPLGLNSSYAVNWEMNLFVGLPIFVFGLLGLCLVKERTTRGLLGVLVAGLLLALGDNTPCFEIFYRLLPGFASLRIHAREGLLVAFTLMCTAGVWLSRPHPKLLAVLEAECLVPVRYLTLGVVLFQAAVLVYGTSQIKRAYSFAAIAGQSPDYPFQLTLITELKQAGLLTRAQPPPLVCVPGHMIPADYGMIHGYSTFDAYTSLFLRRPWDYLHGVLGIEAPSLRNTSVAPQVYELGSFPYRDLALEAGVDPGTGQLLLATNVPPRAFLVYAAEVLPTYPEILRRLSQGHDIHQSALLEKPLAQPLPAGPGGPSTAVPIQQYDPNGLLLEVDAKDNALLVLTEAWYPGWQAEVDGQLTPCIPANLWMRAVPVSAGHHQVRIYFRQNRLAMGLGVSIVSGLVFLGTLVPLFLKRLGYGLPAGLSRAQANQATAAECSRPV